MKRLIDSGHWKELVQFLEACTIKGTISPVTLSSNTKELVAPLEPYFGTSLVKLLSDEILDHVISFVTGPSLAHLKACSKIFWNKILFSGSKSQKLWRYSLELKFLFLQTNTKMKGIGERIA